MFKTKLTGLIAATVLIAQAVSAAGTAEQKEAPKKKSVVLRYSEVNPAGDEATDAAIEFAKLVEERTEGRIKIEVHAGGTLGAHKEVLQALQMGAIDMTRTPLPNVVDTGVKNVPLKLFSLPFLFRNFEHAWTVMRGAVGNEMLDGINQSGVKIKALGYMIADDRNMFTTKKGISRLDDFKGMKIRVQQSDIYMDMVRALGASPTPISFGELYSALQTGVVDGAENPLKGYANSKFYEVSKHFTYSHHMAEPTVVLISDVTWNRIAESDREILRRSVVDAGKYFEKIIGERREGYISELKKANVVFHEVEDFDKWVQAMKPLYEKYGAGQTALIERIQSTK